MSSGNVKADFLLVRLIKRLAVTSTRGSIFRSYASFHIVAAIGKVP